MIACIRSQLTLSLLVVATMIAWPALAAGGLSFDDDRDAAAAEPANPDAPRWFTLEYNDQNSTPTFALFYGVPETDAVLLATRCPLGGAAKSVEVDLMVDYGAAAPGDDVGAIIEAGSKSFSFPAQVFADSEESAGIRLQIGRKSPIWSALRSAPQPKFGIEGSTNMSIASADGAETAIADFAARCLGDAAVTAPLIKMPAVEVGKGGKQPVITLPKIVATTAADTFACDDGSSIGIPIGGDPSARVASLSLASGQHLSLTATAASFGDKYTDGSTTLRVSGATARLTTPAGNQLCRMQ
jgi:hypothetical protein